jgi:NhaA family Na+:H+ antiporter
MTIFFLFVGLEIKREFISGKLSTPKQASLPIAAAIGGMLFPILFYIIIADSNTEINKGWGIPLTTDIAFALGIMTLLGSKVPNSLKVFFLTFAIVADLG